MQYKYRTKDSIIMKLLIVEDEQIIRDGIISHPDWASMGITEVRAASGAKHAFAIMEQYLPDIIISDIQMPGMDGLTMCRKIKENYPNIQIIILTGYDEKEYLKEAIDIGVVSFVEKPLSLMALRRALEKAGKALEKQTPEVANREETGTADKTSSGTGAVSIQENKMLSGINGVSIQESDAAGVLAVKSVKKYIEDHYWEEELSLKILAEKVYLTPQYLSTLFKNETGQTVGQYMSDYRIEQAKRMLGDPAFKLYQISELVGYKDANYFTRLFKKKTGITPMEYKNHHVEE